MIIPKLFRHPLLLLGLLLISSHAGVVLAKEVNSSQDNPGVAMAQTSGQEADTKDKNARSVDGSLLILQGLNKHSNVQVFHVASSSLVLSVCLFSNHRSVVHPRGAS